MGRNSTLPYIVEHIPVLSIFSLRRWGYLVEGENKSGVISWCLKATDQKTDSINVDVYFSDYYKRIVLKYTYRGESRECEVDIVGIDSNLGKGKVWYFVCPKTSKLCRKLYSVNGYFRHREAHSELYYLSQTCSSKDRFTLKHYDRAHPDKAREILSRKYLKKTYKGRPTKIYQWATRKVKISERYDSNDISRMFLGLF